MKKIACLLLTASFLFAGIKPAHSQNNGGFLFTTSSNQASSAFQSALRFYDFGEMKKARAMFQQAIVQDPKFAIAYVLLATLSQSPQEFASNLNKAKENLATANEWEKLVYEYVASNLTSNMDQQLMIAQKMVSQFPKNPRAYTYLAETYAGRKEYAKERDACQKAIAVDSKWPGGYFDLANSYLFDDPKDFKMAQATAMKLVNLSSTSGTNILLGDTYRAQNDLAKADEMYSKAIQLDAESPEALYKRGHARTFLGQFDNARADYEKAGSLDETPIASRSMIALTYLYQDQPEKALDQFISDADTYTKGMDASKATSGKFELLNSAAKIAAHMRNAQKLQEIVSMLKPLSEEIDNAIGTEEAKLTGKADRMIWDGLVQVLNRDYTGAMNTANEIKTILEPIKNPNKLDNYEFLMGCISMRQKDFTNAAAHFEKAEPFNVYHKYWLAKAYEGAGQKDKADAIYKYLANYNFNGIEYALIRNEVRKKI